MSDTKVPSSDWLRLEARRLREKPAAAQDAHAIADAIEELIQRRKDFGGPEEFVVQVAAQLGIIPETHRTMVLEGLRKIQEGVSAVRLALPK